MTIFGEKFGISLEIIEGKLAAIHDGAFKKRIEISENFSSIRRVELSNEIFTSTALDPLDQLFDTTNIAVNLSTGIPKKIFTQNLELGFRKIELIQGINIGQAIIRISHNIQRAMKWQINIPYEKSQDLENTIVLPQNIKIIIQSDPLLKFEENALIFSIQDGFSQIIFYVISEMPYENIQKNLLLISYGDKTNEEIIAMAPGDEQFFPVVTFVYLQDFKDNISRYQDLYQIGSILALRHKHQAAITYLMKALETVRKVGDQYMEAEILIRLGTIKGDSGDYKQATNDFNYALKIIDELQFNQLRLGCLISLSKNLLRLNRFRDALDHQLAILEVMRETQDRLGEAEVMVDISDSLMGLGHIEEAIEYQQAAIQLRRQMRDEVGEANNLIRFGEMLINADRTGEAMSCYEQALRIKRNLGDDKGVAECLKKIGTAFYNRGKYSKAKAYYEKAKEAFQNQALILEVKEIDQLLQKMMQQPFPEGGCQLCDATCTADIVGLAHTAITDSEFIASFKQILRESLASKSMDKLVELLLETARFTSELQYHGITQEAYAYCLMVQATNRHLTQLTSAQKGQIVEMVKENIKIRHYRNL
ncbi:MAG: tetratricopeptide repeat protein [Candidatus Helarchaeota archaeon]